MTMTTVYPLLRHPLTLPDLSGLNKPLAIMSLFSLAALLPTLLAHMFDPRVLDHEAIWLKPMKFQLSMAIHGGTVALAVLLLPTSARRSRWVRWPAYALVVTMAYELTFLCLQAARGVRSHFNEDTAFDAIGGQIMAAGAGVLVTAPMVIAGYILVQALRRRMVSPLLLATVLGLLIGNVLAAYAGSSLGANGGPFVGPFDPADPTLPLFGWSLAIGDLRIAHFFGLHMMQFLPALALLASSLAVWAQYGLVALSTAAFTALTLYTHAVAWAGQVPFGL